MLIETRRADRNRCELGIERTPVAEPLARRSAGTSDGGSSIKAPVPAGVGTGRDGRAPSSPDQPGRCRPDSGAVPVLDPGAASVVGGGAK
jgi:hypothetical protein